jgi:glucose-1-phosphate thymidylyltransferase
MNSERSEIVGLIPAAGFANRISPIPCSKEIYPVGFYKADDQINFRPRVISAYLFDRMRDAGAEKCFMIIRKGKWDIPQYYGTGEDIGLPISFVVSEPTKGASFTIDKAYPFIKNKRIFFGFPDIYFEPKDAYLKLLNRLAETESDVVLGLFHAENPQKVDMVDVDSNGRILEITIKPEVTGLTFTWIIAVWNPEFTEFLHSSLNRNELCESIHKSNDNRATVKEMHLGHIFQNAIDNGLTINSILFENHRYLDIGTPDDLIKAVDQFSRVT